MQDVNNLVEYLKYSNDLIIHGQWWFNNYYEKKYRYPGFLPEIGHPYVGPYRYNKRREQGYLGRSDAAPNMFVALTPKLIRNARFAALPIPIHKLVWNTEYQAWMASKYK